MNIRKIVEKWLADNGYDGLFTPGECACKIGDLMPCYSEGISECQPGHLVSCPGVEECELGGDCDFHMVGDDQITMGVKDI